MTTAISSASLGDLSSPTSTRSPRITSIDALRGLIMFAMIYVNDIAGASSAIVPWWMRHYKADGNGMTFVDLVFPGFLFVVGMSIPFALGSRIAKGEPLWRVLLHVALRTLSLLFIGIVMVNESPDSDKMGWSASLWSALMFLSAILAFSVVSPPSRSPSPANRKSTSQILGLALRIVGFASLVFLIFAYRGQDDHRIVTLVPFSIHTEWYGILGLIGWAYLVAAIVYLLFRTHRTALLACVVLLFCLYPADRKGMFDGFWLANYVGIGGMLGSQAAIAVAGLLLASVLVAPDITTTGSRVRFTFLFIAGCSIGAWLLHGLYGINKNGATPSWCLWACAITATLWLLFYGLSDVLPLRFLTRPFAIAGQNVLLAYLLHNLLYPTLDLLHLDNWYYHLAQPDLAHAVGRSVGCAVVILTVSSLLNRVGFRLRL
ncbi:MAG TPA: DUF5009 domain-containing protein [Tepidisphaeraceae bacterium]|nr:DUF5009 domain-containing protein [Tepidisphaeraceae bacterium]